MNEWIEELREQLNAHPDAKIKISDNLYDCEDWEIVDVKFEDDKIKVTIE